MGLLDFLKPKPKISGSVTCSDGTTRTFEEIDAENKRVHKNNPKYFRSKREKKLSGDFFVKYFDERNRREREIDDTHAQAMTSRDTDERVELFYKALELYDAYKAWCERSEGGKIYFQDQFELMDSADGGVHSYRDILTDRLKSALNVRLSIIPQILQLAAMDGGALQKDLYAIAPEMPKAEMRGIISELERKGEVTKTKKGSSYLIQKA